MSRLSGFGAVALFVIVAGCLQPETAPDGDTTTSPYVPLLDAPIRGLTSEQIRDLREGNGAGFALPAELNGFPGPKHVLDLSDELGLTDEQRSRVQAVRARVMEQAPVQGERVLQAHQRLEEAFRNRTVDAPSLQALVADVDAAYAALRFVHLAAHLEMVDVLTPHQVAQYNQLRGYGSADHAAHTR